MLPAKKLAQLRQNGGVYFDLDGTLLDTAADFQLVLDSLCIDQCRQRYPQALAHWLR
jgi:phosphoglycolate phosphatase-like HAD superfamily hydrolase